MIEHTFRLPTEAPDGRRIVVIGDVHGQAELFAKSLDAVDDPKGAVLILTGDLIDRGPASADCLRLAREAEARFGELIILPGNHEQMAWLGSKAPKSDWAGCFLMNGGDATLREFGGDWDALVSAFPAQVVDRLEGRLPVWHREGGLLFIHAGVNPDIAPSVFFNTPSDPGCPPQLMDEGESPLWVRYPFYANTKHVGPYAALGGDPVLVVYGHTRIGTRDPNVLAQRVEEEIGNWRVAMDASGSGMITVAEFTKDVMKLKILS